MGRESKITKAKADAIVASVRNGAYHYQAAAAVGIHPTTLSRWLETGEADIEHEVEGSLYRYLREELTRAEAQAEADMIGVIRNAALGYEIEVPAVNPMTGAPILDEQGNPVIQKVIVKADWRAAESYLKRKHPQRWGNRQQVTLDGSLTTGAPRIFTPTDEDRDGLLRELSRLIPTTPPDEGDEGGAV